MKFQIEPYLTSMKDGESKVSVFANDINRKLEAPGVPVMMGR